MAEHATHLTSATDVGQPSIFEVLAQENLMTTVRPAGKHAIRVLAESRPERFGWLLQWYDEIYTLFDFILQHHYLSHYSASFAENFYDLKRVVSEEKGPSGQLSWGTKWRSLILLVGVPYVKQKLDQTFEDLKYREDTLSRRADAPLKVKTSRAFLALYPYLHAAWEGTALYHMLAYTFQHSRWHSLPLRMSGTELRHNTDDESTGGVQMAWEAAKDSNWWHRATTGVLRGTVAVLSTGLSVGVFFLQFLDWWYNSDANAPLLTALPTPPPPPRDSTETSAPHVCPLCQRLRTNETALSVSGYVFCFPCIHEYLKTHGCCPVTSYPARTQHLIKIYQPTS
ncbi:peroxisome assembly protein 12-like [Babylonia areolata]|uniref:peroxisome assembly protein 12-like n=1 Tax=Babylonia areolata TaxID=304850 RepID=UPI003FD65344